MDNPTLPHDRCLQDSPVCSGQPLDRIGDCITDIEAIAFLYLTKMMNLKTFTIYSAI
jgi:hypothetical protein